MQKYGIDVGFRAIAEAMPQLVWAASADGTIDYFNRRWIEYTGVTLDDYGRKDRGALGVIHPDELEETWERWKCALAEGLPYEIEHRIRRGSDGTYRWFLERAVPMTDERGSITRWIGTATDVDDQRRSRDSLKFMVAAGNVLATSLNVSEICDALAAATVEHFADWCIVVLAEQGKAKTVAVGHKNQELVRHVKEYRDRTSAGPDAELASLMRDRKPFLLERVHPEDLERDASDAEHLAVVKMLNVHSLMAVPIVTENNAYGAMTIASAHSGRSFNATDVDIAMAVAGRAGIAIENALAFQRERRTAQRLRFVGRVNQLLFESPDVPTTFERVARTIATDIADACAIVRLDGSALRVQVAVSRDPIANATVGVLRGKRMFRPEAELEMADALLKHETLVKQPDSTEKLRERIWPYLAPQAEALAPKTTVVVPLYSSPATYGALVAYYSEREYDPQRDVELLEEVAARTSVALARAETFERERRIATTLQEASLPTLIPTPHGVRLDAVYLPAGDEADVGGDWYDAIELDDGSLVVSVGDVTGRGISAAAIMSKVRHAMGMAPKHETDPARILDSAEWFLRKRYPEAIVTAFVGIVSPDRKRLRYANAGHPWPYLRRDGSLVALQGYGLPLGLRHASEPESSRTVELCDRDLLLLYTDGLVEWNRDVLEGEGQLERLLQTGVLPASTAPAKLVARTCLPAGVHDDVAILAVSLGTPPEWAFAAEDARAAADARTQFVTYLRSHADGADFLARAELIFGELLGNVVRHAPGPVEISLFRSRDGALLHVLDSGTAFELSEQLPADLLSERGRGLYIVRCLARSLKVEHVFNCGNHISVEL
ncbi:MAG: SpoIIE family protein phosphatase [Candidatus Eremiobacteraeota bacterium]|nr:SpoIIE family protein phosphatase [Candidatus Eremiobacteraeota bacterium]